jgi:heat shock protein HtpX
VPPPGSQPGSTNLFDEQAKNRRATALLITAFVLLLGGVGLGVDVFVLGYSPAARRGVATVPIPVAATGAALFGLVSSWASYRFGDRAVLAASRARPVSPDEPATRVLTNVVTEMALAAGTPVPAIYVIDDPDPNAFATGRDPAHASIAVTAGLLTAMNRDELQGVVAHEMSHVRNYDIRTMTVVAALLGAVLLLHQAVTRIQLGGPRQRDRRDGKDGGGGGIVMLVLFVLWLVAIALAPLVGRLLAMAVSRQREYLADATGAALTRNPLGLARALRKLEAATAPTARIPPGTAHLCIADPTGRPVNERRGWLADLFATHPPIGDRIARLEALAYQPAAGGQVGRPQAGRP